jgi:hypothetical protein
MFPYLPAGASVFMPVGYYILMEHETIKKNLLNIYLQRHIPTDAEIEIINWSLRISIMIYNALNHVGTTVETYYRGGAFEIAREQFDGPKSRWAVGLIEAKIKESLFPALGLN